MLDEAFSYVIENSFQKLSLLKSCGANPMQELKAVIVADDTAQLNMHLGEQDPNSSAKQEIEFYLNVSEEANKPVYLKELLERFSARPYGWNRDEVMLQVAHLVLLGKAALSTPNGDLPLNRSYDQFTSVRSHTSLRIRRVRQHSEQQIVKAARLAKDIFQKPFDSSEKELASKLQGELSQWQKLLQEFEFKAKQGHCPGQSVLESGKRLVAGLLDLGNNSYALIEALCAQANDLQDFAEDFEEVEEFYTRQFDTWLQLHRALGEQFRANRHALEQDPDAAALFAQLQAIHDDKQPYAKLRNVGTLVEQISAINLRLVEQQRVVSLQAIERTQMGIKSSVSDLPSDLQNQAMRPFVLLKERVSKSVSLHELVSLVKEADDEEDKVIELINRFSAQQLQAEKDRAEAARNVGVSAPSQVQEPAAGASSGSVQATVEKPVAKPKPAPKPIELVSPTELLGDNHLFIETEQDIDAYLGKLRSRLQQAIDGGKRVRIK